MYACSYTPQNKAVIDSLRESVNYDHLSLNAVT